MKKTVIFVFAIIGLASVLLYFYQNFDHYLGEDEANYKHDAQKYLSSGCDERVVFSQKNASESLQAQDFYVECHGQGAKHKFRVNVFRDGRIVQRVTLDIIEVDELKKFVKDEQPLEISFIEDAKILVVLGDGEFLPDGNHGSFDIVTSYKKKS